MKNIDTEFAAKNIIADIWRHLKQRWAIQHQRTFCWCPVCNEDLCSSHSFLSDTDLVRYRCTNCQTTSDWNFYAPAPLLRAYFVPPFKAI